MKLNEIINIRASQRYRAWLRDFAKAQRIDQSVLVDLALADYAQAHNHQVPPPRLERQNPSTDLSNFAQPVSWMQAYNLFRDDDDDEDGTWGE